MGPFDVIRRYATMLAAALLVLSFSAALVQTFRVQAKQEKVEALTQEMSSLKRAMILSEELRQRNEKLVRKRDSLLREIQDAEDYDRPLPDAIGILLERMREPGADRTP